MLIDIQRDGRTIKGMVHPGRNGYLWTPEYGKEGIGFVSGVPFVRQNVFTVLDKKSGRPSYDEARKPGLNKLVDFCPSLWGGKDWPPTRRTIARRQARSRRGRPCACSATAGRVGAG